MSSPEQTPQTPLDPWEINRDESNPPVHPVHSRNLLSTGSLTEVTISPNMWHAIQEAVWETDEAGNSLHPVITPSTYKELIRQKDIKHRTGRELSMDEMVATFEELQATNVITKQPEAADNDEDRYFLVNPQTAPDPPKPGDPRRVVGWGSSYSDKKTKRWYGEKRAEMLTRKERWGNIAEKIGQSAILGGSGPEVVQKENTRVTEPAQVYDWEAQRLTTLRVERDKKDLAAARLASDMKHMPEDMMRRQQLMNLPPEGMDAQWNGRTPRGQKQRQPRDSGRTTESGPQPATELTKPVVAPEYAPYFEEANLQALEKQISDSIEAEAQQRKDARGIDQLPREEYLAMARGIQNEVTRAYLGDDASDRLVVDLNLARWQLAHPKSKPNRTPKPANPNVAPEHAQFFKEDTLRALHEEITDRIRGRVNAIKEASGLSKLPRDEFKQLTDDTQDEVIRELLGDAASDELVEDVIKARWLLVQPPTPRKRKA